MDSLLMRRPPEGDRPFGESETREYAKPSQRGQSGPGAAAWLRAKTVEALRLIPPGWVVPVRRAAKSNNGGAVIGNVARLWCSGRQHATCVFVSPRRREGKATPDVGPRKTRRFLRRTTVRYKVENSAPFNATGTHCMYGHRCRGGGGGGGRGVEVRHLS